ncbi:MAG TPA: glycoside hydrolase family 3 N-terminal domain-containing protein [Pseudogracilibacillus sp.]|nr:glycoside hydrolase family 3 N-terminal domain-containing protein [Pseudogracilibacillus sp.]
MQLEDMSPEEKIGQLFMVGIDGTSINHHHIHLLKTYRVGGIYYKEQNVKHPKQVHRFSKNLQSYADVDHPLFIAAKQNGGTLNAIQNKTTPGLTPQELGHLKNRVYTKRLAKFTGQELKHMGIQMNLGPELSLSKENPASYGDSNDFTAKHGRAAIEGFQQSAVAAVPTAFPVEKNILKDEAPLYKTPLHPFDYVIKHGAQAIATADASTTATVLRNKLQFDGLILQDYTMQTPTVKQILQSIQDGADMVLITLPYKEQMNAIECMYHALQSGELTEKRLHDALERINHLKKQYISKEMTPFNGDAFYTKQSQLLMQQMSSYPIH